MSKISGTVNSAIPKMIIREKTEANNTIPPLPKMSEEFRYGGEWMDPQWKKDVRVGKKLFITYPVQMAIILVLVAALAIGLALASGGCAPKDAGSPAGGYTEVEDDYSDNKGASGDVQQDNEADTDTSDGFVRPEGNGLEEPITGTVDGAYIEIIDYNLYEDASGTRYLVITLNQTNNSSDTAYASSFYEVYAEQDEYELTNVTGGMEGYGDQYLSDLAPGETREINLFFRGINFDGGDAVVFLSNFWDEDEYVGIRCQMYDLD